MLQKGYGTRKEPAGPTRVRVRRLRSRKFQHGSLPALFPQNIPHHQVQMSSIPISRLHSIIRRCRRITIRRWVVWRSSGKNATRDWKAMLVLTSCCVTNTFANKHYNINQLVFACIRTIGLSEYPRTNLIELWKTWKHYLRKCSRASLQPDIIFLTTVRL